jgi:2-hydroxy-3-keto-5-methylthiopentenyl-1-phosphate phosphatase
MSRFDKAVFFDFDGTITVRDCFMDTLKRFAPEAYAEVVPEFLAGRETLRGGLKRILGAIPSRHLPEMVACARTFEHRPGLVELLDYLDAVGSAALVVSSGLEAMVKASLGPLTTRFVEIHAATIQTDAPTLLAGSQFESEEELIAKAEVLKAFGATSNAVIGDSITDRRIAKLADHVFARDRLIDYCTKDGVCFHPFDDFFDVQRKLAEVWGDG